MEVNNILIYIEVKKSENIFGIPSVYIWFLLFSPFPVKIKGINIKLL